MAKYESYLQGNFDDVLRNIESGVLSGSASASLEDGSDYQSEGVRCSVRVFERYSMIGKNRVSLNVTLIGNEKELFLSAISSGGSQAIFFKINTFGEGAFLQKIVDIVARFE